MSESAVVSHCACVMNGCAVGRNLLGRTLRGREGGRHAIDLINGMSLSGTFIWSVARSELCEGGSERLSLHGLANCHHSPQPFPVRRLDQKPL